MKKGLIAICLSLLLLTGCGSEKTMKCSRTLTQGDLKLDLQYEVTYSGDYVKSVKSVEKISGGTAEELEKYETSLKNVYAAYTELDHYENDVKIDGDVLTSTTTIDYEKIDVDKMGEIDTANKKLFTDGKVKLDDMVSIYEAAGATCEK